MKTKRCLKNAVLVFLIFLRAGGVKAVFPFFALFEVASFSASTIRRGLPFLL